MGNPGQSGAERIPVHVRPARPEDTADVIELTRTIWEGHDYVPRAWPDWLADEQGHLAVAETDERVVGLVDLARLSVDEWWLQGLRVDPQFEGHGVARQLHDYIVQYWEDNFGGALRLTTYQPAVRHMCERGGFRLVGEFSLFKAAVRDDQTADGRMLKSVPDGFFAEPGERLYVRYVDLGWEWGLARPELIAGAGKDLLAWEAMNGETRMLVRHDEEDDQPTLGLAWVKCPPEGLSGALMAFRRLGSAFGYSYVYWTAPLEADALEALQSAGFERDWEGFVWLFERSQSG